MSTRSTSGIMRWLDDDWHRAQLDDDEYETRHAAYQAHLERLAEDAPDDIRSLLSTSLHDGLVQSWSFADGVFEWTVLTGDLQCGYRFTESVYTGASLLGVDRVELTAFHLDRPPAELLSDELEFVDGRWEHRFHFWSGSLRTPGHEFGIRFSEVNTTETTADAEGRNRWWARAAHDQ